MQRLTLLMIVVVTTFEFLTDGDHWGNWAVLPGPAPFLAELLGAAAIVFVVFAGTRSRFQFVRPAYWLVFAILVVTIACGVAVNSVGSGPIFAGIRTYVRAIPWFFVPAVFAYSEGQIRTQLRLLLGIGLIQLPLAVQQRIASGGGGVGAVTGDWTSGTLVHSSTLSIFLICAACVIAALFVRKQLKAWQFIALILLFLFPTTINETKATLFLLPVGLLAAVLTAAEMGRRLRYVLLGFVVLAVFVSIFFPIYDYMNKDRAYAVPLSEMLGDRDRLERYLQYKKDVGTTGEVGKVDSLVVTVRRLSTDPLVFVFGYGIGNVSDSALGRGFVGRYYGILGPFLGTTFGRVTLELGFLGLTAILALMWMILRDARVVARRESGLIGAFAAGWVGVTIVMTMCIIYTDTVSKVPLAFLFWYGAGLVAAARMRSCSAVAPGSYPGHAEVSLPART